MAKIIQTSFKEGEDSLYQEVLKHSDRSAFIKDCINFYINSQIPTGNTPKDEKNNHFSQTTEVVDILQNL